jgi:sugar/nucleoside kinase (ribokinase family)
MKILVVGELNVDLILRNYSDFPTLGREVLVEEASMTLGSAAAICAAGLAKLGNAVTFLGKVGDDAWGRLCVDSLDRLGVDTSLVMRDPTVGTGITVAITSAKDRALVTCLGSIAALRASEIDEAVLGGFDHLHMASYFLQQGLRPGVKGLLGGARRRGLTTSLDPGCDPEDRWAADLTDALIEADVFLPNEVELAGVTGRCDVSEAVRALQNGHTLTIAKLGARGCAAMVDGEIVRVPGRRVETVDTTGAGDSFNAGFLHAWLSQRPLREAMLFANACGALSTRASGGTGSQATEQQALEFMAGEVCA